MEKMVKDIQSEPRSTLLEKLRKTFECIVCRSTVRSPVINSCCSRIVGCERCVRRWLVSHKRCPLCSVEADNPNLLSLKGMDDIFSLIKEPSEDKPDSPFVPPAPVLVTSSEDDDDMEELGRNFRLPRSLSQQ